jgi:hypothetical protein
MDINKNRIVKELETKGIFVSSAQKTDNNVYNVNITYNKKRGNLKIRMVELVPNMYKYDSIYIPGAWEKSFGAIVFIDNNNTILFNTSNLCLWPWSYLADNTKVIRLDLYKLGYKKTNNEM